MILKKDKDGLLLPLIGGRNFCAVFHESCIYFALTSFFLLAKIARKHQDNIFTKNMASNQRKVSFANTC